MKTRVRSQSLHLAALALLLALLPGLPADADTSLAQAPPAQGKAPQRPRPHPPLRSATSPRLFPPTRRLAAVHGAGRERLAYTATAGDLAPAGRQGRGAAHVFHVAYTLEEEPAARPITFVFNGGPGAASAFLHLGAMGPRAVNFAANGAAAVQPVALADNPDTWLDFTDLVFVDPVATGYSRSAAGTEEAGPRLLRRRARTPTPWPTSFGST